MIMREPEPTAGEQAEEQPKKRGNVLAVVALAMILLLLIYLLSFGAAVTIGNIVYNGEVNGVLPDGAAEAYMNVTGAVYLPLEELAVNDVGKLDDLMIMYINFWSDLYPV